MIIPTQVCSILQGLCPMGFQSFSWKNPAEYYLKIQLITQWNKNKLFTCLKDQILGIQ